MNKKRIGRWPLSLLIMFAMTTQAMLAVGTSGADAPEDDEEVTADATPTAKRKTKKIVRRKKDNLRKIVELKQLKRR
ncbi:hypothetical protein IPF37_01205 [bacterium]|nr:MAG: hypothetical protein IPF37_01205 [bacterium]